MIGDSNRFVFGGGYDLEIVNDSNMNQKSSSYLHSYELPDGLE